MCFNSNRRSKLLTVPWFFHVHRICALRLETFDLCRFPHFHAGVFLGSTCIESDISLLDSSPNTHRMMASSMGSIGPYNPAAGDLTPQELENTLAYPEGQPLVPQRVISALLDMYYNYPTTVTPSGSHCSLRQCR